MVRQTVSLDDGKGRTFTFSRNGKPSIIQLNPIENWEDISKPGEYSFSCQIGSWGLECLVMNCPFCGYLAPLPILIKIVSKQPLTIQEEMYCKNCCTNFHVIDDKAIESWIPGGLQCQ